jgi:hypothetical protein
MSVEDVHRYLTKRLSQAGVEIAIGRIDYSLNIDREGKWPNHWARQAWIVVPKQNQSSWDTKLRDAIQPTDLVPQPVFVRAFDGDPKGYAYALKTTFNRRESYSQTKRHRGSTRTCRNTSIQPLRNGEWEELLLHLDRVGLAERVLFQGVKPISTFIGQRLHRIGDPQIPEAKKSDRNHRLRPGK